MRHRDHFARWVFSIVLAARPSEIRGLTWDDVWTLEEKNRASGRETSHVIIRHQLACRPDMEENGTRLHLKPDPKTRAGVRTVPLPKGMVAILLRWKTQEK